MQRKNRSHKKTNGKAEYKVISNCPKCKGAVFVSHDAYETPGALYKCFQCSRLFTVGRDGTFELYSRVAHANQADEAVCGAIYWGVN